MEINEYLKYFKKIAEDHPEIKGFCAMDINEILEGDRKRIAFPLLFLEPIVGTFKVTNKDNILELVQGSFLLLDQSLEGKHDCTQIYDHMNKIGKDIISKLDSSDQTNNNLIMSFDMNSVSYELVGPLFHNNFGLIFSYNFLSL